MVNLGGAATPYARSRHGCDTGSAPWRVLDRVKRPVAFQPSQDCAVNHWVEGGMVRAHPGPDGRMPFAPAAATWACGVRRVDVHAADDLAGADAQHGVGEPAALGEVLGVAFEVAQIVRQAHLVWPALPGESRRRLDVVDAGRPCGIVRGVVLRPERFQPELLSREPARYREIHGNEKLTHQAMLTGRPSHRSTPAAGTSPRLLAYGRHYAGDRGAFDGRGHVP